MKRITKGLLILFILFGTVIFFNMILTEFHCTNVSTEIRFITVGDLHIYDGIDSNNSNRLKRVVDVTNQAYSQGKLDFIVFVGDIVDMSDIDTNYEDASAILSNLNPNLTRYFVAGNHDVMDSECITSCPDGNDKPCKFKKYLGVFPEQYYKFTKSGKIFNIIIPGICIKDKSWSTMPNWYFDFDNPDIDKTLPSLVFNHGPLNAAGQNWDEFYLYAIENGIDKELIKFKRLLGGYAGHIHRESNQVIVYPGGNAVRFVTDNALSRTDYIGYTRVTDCSIDYELIRYQKNGNNIIFLDPFP